MLEGKNVNLRVMEKEDLPLIAEWANDPMFGGEYEPLEQVSLKEVQKCMTTFALKKNGSYREERWKQNRSNTPLS